MSLYFISSLIYASVHARAYGPKVIIYVTQWVFYLWNFQVLWAAIFVTVTYLKVYFCQMDKFQRRDKGGPCNHELVIDNHPVGCCGVSSDETLWYQKIYWLLYTLATDVTILVVVVYWSFIYAFDPVIEGYAYANFVKHLIVGIMAVVDLFLTAIPIRILHFIYTIILGVVWFIFSSIYLAAGGTDYYGNRYIYKFLNYGENVSFAVSMGFVLTFVIMPLIHSFVYCIYLLREGLLYLARKHFCSFIAGGFTHEEINENDETEFELIELESTV